MKITNKRPSVTKKTMSMDDLDNDTVGLHIRVPRDLRKLINQRALDKGCSAKEVLLEVIEKEFK